MRDKKYDSTLCVRLNNGEDFMQQLKQLAQKYKLTNAVLINGVGMLKDAKIGYFHNGTYQTKTIYEPTELISTSGNMYLNPSGKQEWHIHVALGEKSHAVEGGHLMGGTVWNTAEIFLKILPDATFVRENEEGNLRLNFK